MDSTTQKLQALEKFNGAFNQFSAALSKFSEELSEACKILNMQDQEFAEFQKLEEEERNRPF